MDFCTFGMLIIDEIHHAPPRPPSYNVIGGAGTFAASGARLFRPPPSSSKVSWTVHRGYDFPVDEQREIDSWQTALQWVETPERQTTRAINEYVVGKGNDFRAFRYTSAKIRLEETHLTDEMVRSRSFHMVCSPERCMKLVQGVKDKRHQLQCAEKPIFIWEPVPDLCDITALEAVKTAACCVDVVSPNISELAALFVTDETPEEEQKRMEERCLAILKGGLGEKGGAVIVRCGSEGCYLRSLSESRRLPAFWSKSEAKEHVIDPTGAGNQFLGGLCIGLQDEEPAAFSKLERGAIFGSIAASFAVEQVGAPKFSKGESGIELWNCDSVESRMQRYIDRLQQKQP